MKLNRKPIQIAVGPQPEDDEGRPVVHGCRLFALCDDGTIWYNDMTKNELDEWNWWEVPLVPQGPMEDITRDPSDLADC